MTTDLMYRIVIGENDIVILQMISEAGVFELVPVAEDEDRIPGLYDENWKLLEKEEPPILSLNNLEPKKSFLAALLSLKKYSDDQPRDERGRWSSGGSSGGGTAKPEGSSRTASELFAAHDDPTVTADQIIDSVPGAREALSSAQAKLAQGTETNKLYKDSNGNYTPEREAIHQQIVNSYLNDKNITTTTPAEGEKPTMTILGGRGGSGKSYLTSSEGPVKGDGVDNDNHTVGNALYLNSDDIKAALPEYQGWNAPLLHEEATDIFDKVDAQARDLGLNVVHDSTMKTADTAIGRLSAYQDQGYNLEGHYMFAPPQVAASQATGRFMRGTNALSDDAKAAGFTGRLVSPSYVLGSRTNESSFDKATSMFSSWSIYVAGATGGGKPSLYTKGGK